MQVGFAGLGLMGASMAMNIHKAGYELSVYNRSAEKGRPFAELGVKVVKSPAELAAFCDVIIICVSDSPDVESVFYGENGIMSAARPGLITIDCSTILPDVEKRICQSASIAGFDHLDAPVSGGTKGAKAGTLAIMVGGNELAYVKSKPVLDTMGTNVTYVGESGSGQVIKLANQAVLAGNVLGLCEGLVIAKKHGLDMSKAISILSNGTASNWTLLNQGKQMMRNDWSPGFYVKLFKKDLSIVQSLARQTDICLPCSSLALSLYNALSNEEGGDEMGHQALLKLFYKLSGIEEGKLNEKENG
jgi:3-hydroxyisobutyrate dehydrogenase